MKVLINPLTHYVSKWLPSKHLSAVSTLSFGLCWYDPSTWDNVKSTLCMPTLEFTTSNNVKSTLCISTLIWTTLDNVQITWSFLTSSFTTLGNVETTLWKWPFPKRTKKKSFQSFNYYFIIFFILSPILIGICWRIFAKPQKLLKDQESYCIART